MSRIVCLSYHLNHEITIRGKRYRIAAMLRGNRTLTLETLSSDKKSITISRNELAALIITEEAELHDELEDPSPGPLRKYTDISNMSINRILDWQGKIYLFKKMVHLSGSSPKSKQYRAAFEMAAVELKEWQPITEPPITNSWSVWTTYHDILRWRANRYEIGALQRKGVEYTPWRIEAPNIYELATRIAHEIALASPELSKANIHKQTNERLKSEWKGAS